MMDGVTLRLIHNQPRKMTEATLLETQISPLASIPRKGDEVVIEADFYEVVLVRWLFTDDRIEVYLEPTPDG